MHLRPWRRLARLAIDEAVAETEPAPRRVHASAFETASGHGTGQRQHPRTLGLLRQEIDGRPVRERIGPLDAPKIPTRHRRHEIQSGAIDSIACVQRSSQSRSSCEGPSSTLGCGRSRGSLSVHEKTREIIRGSLVEFGFAGRATSSTCGCGAARRSAISEPFRRRRR
jgi:hypothetical protein